MVWLPDGEKISKISLFVLAQLTNVTDGQTDGQTPHAGSSTAVNVLRVVCVLWFSVLNLKFRRSQKSFCKSVPMDVVW